MPDDIRVKCLYCECDKLVLQYKQKKHPVWVEMNNIDIYACQQCGSLITYPMPDPSLLAFCYSKYAFGGYPAEKSKAKKGTQQNHWYKDILKEVQFSNKSHGDVADVGSGEGWLTHELLSSEAECEVYCFDHHAMPANLSELLSPSMLDRLYWKQVELNNDVWGSLGEYDHVFCVSVIEHVENPKELVHGLYKICKPGGKIYILGPDAGSFAYRFSGSKWVYMIPGEHLTVPTVKGLENLVSKMPYAKCHLREINVTYSLKYIFDALTGYTLPAYLDVILRLPVGAFLLEITKDDGGSRVSD